MCDATLRSLSRGRSRFFGAAVLFVLACSATAAQGATYYVDPASGNNSNAGTSTGAPWRNPPGTRNTGNGGFIGSSWGGITTSNKLACGDTVILRAGATQGSAQGGAWLIDSNYYSNCTAASPITIKVSSAAQWAGSSGHFTLNGSGISPTYSQTRGYDSHRALINVADRAHIRVVGEDASRRLVVANTSEWSINAHCAGCTSSGFRGNWLELRDGDAGFNIGDYNDWQVSNSIAHDLRATGWATGLNSDRPVDRGGFVDVEVYRSGSSTQASGNDDGFFFVGGRGVWCVRCVSHHNNQRGFNTGVIANTAGNQFNFRFRNIVSYDNGQVCTPSGGVGCIGAGFEVSGNDFQTSANSFNHILGATFFHNGDTGAGNYLAATLEIWNAVFYRTHYKRQDLASVLWDTTSKQLSLFNSVDLGRPGFQAFAWNNSNPQAQQPRLPPITGNNCFSPPSSNSNTLGISNLSTGTYSNPPSWIGSTNQVGTSACVPNFTALHDSTYASTNFTPTAGSSLIDNGRFVMLASAAGSNSTTIPVKANGGSSDPRNFFIGQDSFLDPAQADRQIQIEGCGQRTAVSMTASSITFTPACSWASNAGVHLPWAGNRPDIGAKESGLSGGGGGGGGAPAPPQLLSVDPLP